MSFLCLLIMVLAYLVKSPSCYGAQMFHGWRTSILVHFSRRLLSLVYAQLLGFLLFLCFHMIQYLFLMIYVFIFPVIFIILCCHIVVLFSCPSLLMLCSIVSLRLHFVDSMIFILWTGKGDIT